MNLEIKYLIMAGLEEAGFETWQVRSKAGEASEADIWNVAISLKKAQQIWGQIAQAKIKDQISAEMLKLIIQNIDNEKILNIILKLLNEYEIEIDDMFTIFFPVLKAKINNPKIIEKYKTILNVDCNSVSLYWDFIKIHVFPKMNISKISADEMVEFIKQIVMYFDIGQIDTLSKQSENIEEFNERLKLSLRSVFYN